MWNDWKPLTLQDRTGFQHWCWMDVLMSWHDSLVIITLVPTSDNSLSVLFVFSYLDVRTKNIMMLNTL